MCILNIANGIVLCSLRIPTAYQCELIAPHVENQTIESWISRAKQACGKSWNQSNPCSVPRRFVIKDSPKIQTPANLV